MIIKVLGSGCSKCKKLEENVNKAIAESGVAATVEKVTDLTAIMAYGVMTTPALVIDEKVVSSGKLLSPSDVKAFINKGM
ncbi:MAG: redox-active disulfide protein 2 [Candidatus Cloacimonetes bacterium HGW-Cloacimonetes-3]|jgi:small redox-active disulfide protein 2|nr:MAG: redox-active disulfide protein 2 [Candidatus Cloacimonetes bacterium HGW-Cloacimonetes-3]PKN96271.1 MAG: redox-active disulfide protein 2 [Chloroflexi bacterium HGW-Chloroflexi-5]